MRSEEDIRIELNKAEYDLSRSKKAMRNAGGVYDVVSHAVTVAKQIATRDALMWILEKDE